MDCAYCDLRRLDTGETCLVSTDMDILFACGIFDFFFLGFAGVPCTLFAVFGVEALCGSPGTMDVIIQTRHAKRPRVLHGGTLHHVIALNLTHAHHESIVRPWRSTS